MLEAFLRFIRHHRLISPSDEVMVAVSGGIDSMVLLDLLLQSDTKISVAHMNFGLRGLESDGDEEFVREQCAAQGVRFHCERPDLNTFAREHRLSTQMAARQLRYDWFRQLTVQYGYQIIATAHHLDDQAETMVMQFLHGKGELTGISLRNGNVIRPMLFTGRQEISRYAKERGISWREDSSNLGNDYMRNQIRHQVIPVLRDINPAFRDAMARIHFRAQGISEVATIGLKLLQESICAADDQGRTVISLNRLSEFQHPAALLYLLVRDFGFTDSQCTDIIEGLDSGTGRIFQSSSFQMVQDRAALILQPLTKSEDESIGAEAIIDGPGIWRLGNLRLECSLTAEISTVPAVACLDREGLRFPLCWRRWSPGDSIVPLGMEGRKKVSDLLIDLKVSLPDKEFVTVVTSGGELVWVAGYRISEKFKVTDRTKAVFRMELLPESGS